MLEGHLMNEWDQDQHYVLNNIQFGTLEREFLTEAWKIAELDVHVIPEMLLVFLEQTVTYRWV